jgi:uncharacterized protein GlcG (DUF336 family)
LVDLVFVEARRRGVRVAVTVCDRGGDPIQQDAMEGSATAGSIVAEAVARSAARFELPSSSVRADLAALLPTEASVAPGGLPIRGNEAVGGLGIGPASSGDAVFAAIGIGGPDPDLCHEIAAAVLA